MKYLFLVCTLICTSYVAEAQLRFGPKVGANYSVVYGSPEEYEGEKIESVSPSIGFQVGGFVETNLTERLGLLVELAYEAKRSKKSATDPTAGALGVFRITADVDTDTKYNSINLPVLFTFGSEKFRAYIGPNFGWLLSSKSNFTQVNGRVNPKNPPITGTTLSDAELLASGMITQAQLTAIDQTAKTGVEQTYEVDFFGENAGIAGRDYSDEPYMNQLEIGLNIGGMLHITNNLFLDVRVHHGITDRTNNTHDKSLVDGSARSDADRSAGVQVSIGYKF